jgi:hypothetical protein
MKRLALMFSAFAVCIAIPASAETHGPTCTAPCPAGKECALALTLPYDAEQSVLVASKSLSIGDGTTVKAGREARRARAPTAGERRVRPSRVQGTSPVQGRARAAGGSTHGAAPASGRRRCDVRSRAYSSAASARANSLNSSDPGCAARSA